MYNYYLLHQFYERLIDIYVNKYILAETEVRWSECSRFI